MTVASTPTLLFRIEVPFGPRWQHAELLRISILHCVATVFSSHDFCERLGMVAAELVENAIHYGDWSGADPRPFRLRVEGTEGGGVVVGVESPIDPRSSDADRLTQGIARLRAANAEDAYAARLREIAEKPDATGSGLGLLRIVHETGCRLDAHIEGATARVVATLDADT
jgi:hypothetical protein